MVLKSIRGTNCACGMCEHLIQSVKKENKDVVVLVLVLVVLIVVVTTN